MNNFRNSKRKPYEQKETAAEKRMRRKFTGEGKITLVEYQKTHPDRVNIHIEEEYAFSVTAILAAERKLKAGLYLTAEAADEIQNADLYNRGLAAGLQMLAMRPRSEAELRDYLRRRYPDATAETLTRVLDRLKELNYLNDTSFAKFWVENRLAFAPRGRNLLKQELMKKRVARDIIDTVIQEHLEALQEEADEDGNDSNQTVEETQALELARKKAHSYAAEAWPGFYRKLGSFLQRRGYNYDITGKITKQVWQELKSEEAGEVDEEYL
ncbi:MAG: Regulatory protein RecX [Chloroflexi bacterium]|jgi:regulatory protein|nr:Regulatory protein RecX [Chloroflexota bacterium]